MFSPVVLSSVLTWSCAPLCPVRCVPVLSRQPGDWWEWKEQRADPPDLERPVKGFPGHCRPLPPGSTPGSQVGRGQTHFLILSNHLCFHSLSQGAQISLFFFKLLQLIIYTGWNRTGSKQILFVGHTSHEWCHTSTINEEMYALLCLGRLTKFIYHNI